MAKSIKLKDNTYWDGSGVSVQGHKTLNKQLESHDTFTIGGSGHSSYPLYYFLGRLPVTSNTNSSSFRINGFLGAFGSSQKAIVDIIIGNRDGLNYYGTYIGQSSALTNSQIKIYQESDGRHSIYYVQNAQYTGGASLNLTGTGCDSFYTSSTTPVTPTGTLVKTIDASALTKLDYSSSITTEANGWRKKVYPDRTEYWKFVQFSHSFTGGGWGWISTSASNLALPSGVTYHSSNMSIKISCRCEDSAISLDSAIGENGSSYGITWRNKYGSAVNNVNCTVNLSLTVYN